ncbi:hypothetical protein GCM10009606_13250 [Nocardioides aquiterrae]|uniref:Uncharacterized protein n=1 Tax=Nocardioides aquiterrae TaxID=203799 RepID=A0ABN1UDL5_9ACTN
MTQPVLAAGDGGEPLDHAAHTGRTGGSGSDRRRHPTIVRHGADIGGGEALAPRRLSTTCAHIATGVVSLCWPDVGVPSRDASGDLTSCTRET